MAALGDLKNLTEMVHDGGGGKWPRGGEHRGLAAIRHYPDGLQYANHGWLASYGEDSTD